MITESKVPYIPALETKNVTIENIAVSGNVNSASAKNKLSFVSADVVQEMEIPETPWIIKNFLTEGLCLLGGSPKVGKSWFALAIALAACLGESVLGFFDHSEKIGVLYIPYEDNFRRLKFRVNKLLKSSVYKIAPANLYYPQNENGQVDFPAVNDGGLDVIKECIDAHPDIKIVVIDTLGRAKKQRGGRNTDAFLDDYEFSSRLQKLAMEKHLCILMVHHMRKAVSEDIFEKISGTTGLTAAPDVLLVLQSVKQSETRKEGKLHVRSRDFADNIYALYFDMATCHWLIQGNADKVEESERGTEIISLYGNDHEKVLQLKDIAAGLNTSSPNASKIVSRLLNKGLLSQASRGKYKLVKPAGISE
jgi:RecA-family ATPase